MKSVIRCYIQHLTRKRPIVDRLMILTSNRPSSYNQTKHMSCILKLFDILLKQIIIGREILNER